MRQSATDIHQRWEGVPCYDVCLFRVSYHCDFDLPIEHYFGVRGSSSEEVSVGWR